MFLHLAVSHSVHRRGGGVSQHAFQVVSQHALQQVSRVGVVFQYALQVSRPSPRGEVEGSGQEGVTRPTPRW